MSCLACLLAFLSALVFGRPELGHTVQLELCARGATVAVVESGDEMAPVAVGWYRREVEAGLRLVFRV